MNKTKLVEIVNPLTDPRWLRLALANQGGLFHSVPWLKAVANAYGFSIQAALEVQDGEPVAGLTFCRLDDCAGSRIVSLPFTDACDPIGDSSAIPNLVAHLQGYKLPVQLRFLDAAVPDASGLSVAKRARWHRLSITDPEAMWQALSPAMRRCIAKARRDGVAVEPLSGDRAIEAFLQLHAAVRKSKYRLLAQPARFFESIRHEFSVSGDWLPMGAFHQGRLIAVTIYLRSDRALYYKFNASAQDALSMRPNNLLLWEGAQMAHRLDCQTLDLGPSDDTQPGLIRFKQDSGATCGELSFLRWSPEAWDDPRAAEVRRVLGQLTGLLTEASVPDEISIRAGDLLYRYFA